MIPWQHLGNLSAAHLLSSLQNFCSLGSLVASAALQENGSLDEKPRTGGGEEDFTCDAEGCVLTDLELPNSAFAYEVEERKLPEPYLPLGLSGMKKLDQDCCTVLREDNPFNEPCDV